LERSVLRQMIAVVSLPGILSFAGGLPAPELFPMEDLRVAFQQVLDNDASSLQYSSAFHGLKEHIVKLMAQRGIECDTEDVFITTGAQQGLDILARLFLNPGGDVILEESIYTGVQQVVNPLQPKYHAVGTDLRTGIDVDAVEALLQKGLRPPFLYVVPNAQNPLGVTVSHEKRKKLIALAKEYEVPLIEDDPYGFLSYEEDSPPCLRAMEKDWVFYLGSFSKVLAPGLRLGWMLAPRDLIPTLTVIKEAYDLESSGLTQRAVSAYLDLGVFDEHLKKLCTEYGRKRDLMLKAMDDFFPKSARWTRPDAGMFIWVVLDERINAADLLTYTLEREKVAFIPGYAFSVPGTSCKNCIRLNFSSTSAELIPDGIRRLADSIRAFTEEKLR